MTINDTCAFNYVEFQRRLLALGQNPKYSSEYPGHDPDYIAHNKKMADYYQSPKAQVAVYRLLMARDISTFDHTDVPLTPLMENWRAHNPAAVADFCINLGREYSHMLKDESKPNSRGPPTSLLHAVYRRMYASTRDRTWDRNKLTLELNAFLSKTGEKACSGKPGDRNIVQMQEWGLPTPAGNVEGFWGLSLEKLEEALKEKHLVNFSFAEEQDEEAPSGKRRRMEETCRD